jgi:hypothetical protein
VVRVSSQGDVQKTVAFVKANNLKIGGDPGDLGPPGRLQRFSMECSASTASTPETRIAASLPASPSERRANV